MNRLVLGLALLVAAPVFSYAEESAETLGDASVSELQAIVDEAGKKFGLGGAQVSIVLGEQYADFVYGTANAELDVPMTVDTIIQIGSSTKVLNAAIAMTLVDEGKIDLDTPIGEYIPGFRISDMQAAELMSYRHLLSMSSGLDNGSYARHGGGEDALERYINSLEDIPQAFKPGEGFGYSNAGTSIAGYASQLVAGESWDMLLKKRIFEPAGIKNAASLAQDLPFQRVSVGHLPATGDAGPTVVRPWYMQQAQGPAGSTLAMSARDLARFGELFLNSGVARDGTRVLSEESVNAMMTPTTDVPVKGFADQWGLGPYRADWGKTYAWGHAGGNQSGTSYLWWFPERLGVLSIVVNTPATGGKFMDEIFDRFGPLVFDARKPKLAAPDTPVVLDDPERYAGTYEMYGASYEVALTDAGLNIVFSMKMHGMQPQVVADSPLTPLGDDRFIYLGPDGSPSEVAFFTEGDDGLMQNLVTVFAARRVD